MRKAFTIACAVLMSFATRANDQHTGQVDAHIKTRGDDQERFYAVIFSNKSDQSIEFDAVPDIGYSHSACTHNTIVPATASQWDARTGAWKAFETFISGVATSGERHYKTTKYKLLPGHSLCVGWWAPDAEVLKRGDKVRITACTSFTAESECFNSPPFEIRGRKH